jgi:F0F1-type ATP synthase assembly protein I
MENHDIMMLLIGFIAGMQVARLALEKPSKDKTNKEKE